MVNWQERDIALSSGHIAFYIGAICTGVYLWEFTLNLKFDWQYFRQKRPFRWALVPYLVARYLCAVTVILEVHGGNILWQTGHCTIWLKLAYACAHLAIAAATLLLVIRVIALGGRKHWITVCLISLWLVECGTLVRAFVVIEGVYTPELFACAVTNSVQSRLNVICSFAINLVCLAIVLLFLSRSPGDGVWNLLLSQGVTYFVVVMVAYIPPMVLLILYRNAHRRQPRAHTKRPSINGSVLLGLQRSYRMYAGLSR